MYIRIQKYIIFAEEKDLTMEENVHKNSWGGKREGAGRPSTHSKLYSFRLSEEIAKIVDAQKNKTAFIKECIERSQQQMKSKVITFGDVYPATALKNLHLPFFDIGIVAGFPIPLDNDERAQDINLLSLLCPNPESCYLIRVKGESMIDAGIRSGDIVIVDKSNREPTEKQVAVCEYNGEYTLKHFMKKNGIGWLVPDNPEFPRIEIKEGDNFSVWGVVTYIIHKPIS